MVHTRIVIQLTYPRSLVGLPTHLTFLYPRKKRAVIEDFIKQAMKRDVSIIERIKALEYFDKRIEELSSKYNVIDVDAEQDLLSGPTDNMGISKFGYPGNFS